jgi:arylsulfatase
MNGAPAGRRELRARIDEIGGPTAHNNYPWGWTMAGNTPFKRWKREVHEGGVADPCIVSAPGMTGRGGTRRQFAHAVDVLPTVLELVGIDGPAVIDGLEQSRVDGASFAPALRSEDAPETHETQHFEMLGSRGIYHRGWKAVTFHPLGAMYDDGLDPDAPFDDDVWELYDVVADPSETNDLAAAEPERLAAMVELWWEEAARNDVLPLDNRPLFAILNPRPTTRQSRTTYVYYPNGAPVPEAVAVNVRNRSHTITATITVPAGVVPEGTLLALGSVLGGFTFQMIGGRLRYVHNLYGASRDIVDSDAIVGPGARRVAYAFTKTGEFTGRGELLVDGEVVGAGDIPHFTPMTFSYTGGGLTCGYEVGPAVGASYEAPFRANVEIDRVVVDVSGSPHRDPEGEYDAIMAEQ